MAGGQASSKHFAGHQTVATVDALETFVRSAEAGARFTYCEAPQLLRGETSARANELAQAGLVTTHQSRREGGGWRFFVERTRYKPARNVDPVAAALADAATALIFTRLKQAANFARPCPPDTELMRAAGLTMRQQAGNRVRKLIDLGLIASELVYEGGIACRVVTIAAGPNAGSAGGKSTALPKKWAKLMAAAAKDAAAGAATAAPHTNPAALAAKGVTK